MSTDNVQPSLQSQIPARILNKVKGKPVVETSFATGPSFCAGKVEEHSPAITLEQGLAWLERYRGDLKGGCIVFKDESRLCFSWGRYSSYVAEPKTPRPQPGVEMADLTDPAVLRRHGLNRRGEKIILKHGGKTTVLGEFTAEQMGTIRARKSRK
jgi:hypothetical protein